MLQCFVCSPIPKVREKKGATGQSFIRKEITSYRIGTLVIMYLLSTHCPISTNSVSSNFFPNETLTGCPFFSLTFGIGEYTKHCSMSFLYSSTRNDVLQCFVRSPIPKVSEKKGQRVRVSFGKKLLVTELVLLVKFA